jgi:hypothetical protein
MRFDEEIAARPPRTWHQTETQKREVRAQAKGAADGEKELAARAAPRKLTVDERAVKMAADDDYGERDGAENMKHPVSRSKRRRQEAMGTGDEGDNEGGTPVDDSGRRAKASLKKGDRAAQAKAEEPLGARRQSKRAQGGEVKIRRPRAALGGLDADVFGGATDVFRSRKSSRVTESLKDFKEFDPNMRLRKQGKLGKSAFKSKGKFKRRK